MAKDVDLSSDEWRDLVFEGKNKDFGAYELRRESPKRHNIALIAVAVFIVLVLVANFLVNSVLADKEEDQPKEKKEQAVIAEIPEDEVMDEEEVIEKFDEPEPEVVEEPVLENEKMTEILIVKDEDVKEPPRSQDEAQTSDVAVGAVNQEGIKDALDQKVMDTEVKVEPTPPPAPPADDVVFTSVEQDPQFPGGQAALLKWVTDHIKYPAVAQENGIQGRVTVQFVVTKNGTVGQVKVVRGKDPDLDKEAIRVVKSLPKFTPGKMNGHPVNVWYTLPITFRLQGM